MTRQDFIKIAKKLVSEIDQPSLDIYAVEQMWDDIEKVSKKLRDVNKRLEISYSLKLNVGFLVLYKYKHFFMLESV